MDYKKSVIEEHPVFAKYKEKINKFGIELFLENIGIFPEIIPVYKPPNEKGELNRIGYNIKFEYRLNEMKDENHFKMEVINDFNTYTTKEEAETTLFLKAFEIINTNIYLQDKIDSLN
jgi:hypothetical protein